MKRFISLLLTIQLIANLSYSQWMNQLSNTNRTLYDIEFLNNKTGWVVGVGGTIRKTTNGGINWFVIVHPVGTKLLSSIHLVDSNYVYVVGDFETIIKTSDGGNSWEIIRNGPIGKGSSYEGLFFINKDTGWICGNSQYILRTSNGGLDFDSTFLFWGILSDIYFKNQNTGVMSGWAGGVFKTTNSGSNWYQGDIILNSNQPNFRKLSFINKDTGWITGGDGRVFRTTNCGTSWDSIYHLNTLPNVMYCAEFVNDYTGWVSGENGIIYKTTNTGQSWTQQISNTSNLITSMWFYNDSLGWASCGFGGILNTTNGGLTHINSAETMKNNFRLFQNYPNPFNPITQIHYELHTPGFVSLKVYDILGNVVETLVEKIEYAGLHSVEWGGTNFSSGIYFYRLITGEFSETKKMILQK